jgi:hypothetical protein
MASLQDRVIGALRLQPATFEEVEHDATATSQAATVVAIAALSGAIATLLYSFNIVMFLAQIVLGLIGWVIGSAVIYFVGTRLLPGKNTEADLGQVLRVAGFAQSPGLFGIINVIPILGWLIGVALAIWSIVALVIGVRQALDYDDTLKAVIVCVIAWAIMFVVTLLGAMLGFGHAAMSGAF